MKRKKFDKSEVGLLILAVAIILLIFIAPDLMAGSLSYTVPFKFTENFDSCVIYRMNAEDTTTFDTIGGRADTNNYDTAISISSGDCSRIVAHYRWTATGDWADTWDIFCPSAISPFGTVPTIGNMYKCIVGGWIYSAVTADPLPGAVVTFNVDAGEEGVLISTTNVNILSGSLKRSCKTNSSGYFEDTLIRSRYLLSPDSTETGYIVSWKWGIQSFIRPTKYIVPNVGSDTLDWYE